jgi:4-methyl-5(b-hydroxyethyl)-thiazole monophosphate biosynthesis
LTLLSLLVTSIITMKKILILLSNGFEIYEAAAFIDVLGWANTFGSEKIEIVTAGFHPKLTSTFGLRIIPDTTIDTLNLDEFNALALPGGFENAGFYKDAYTEEFLKVIRHFDHNNKIIASICVGALPLGKSGILINRPATTYHLLDGKRRRQLAEMGGKVIDRPIVEDENIITSTSPATAMEVAFLLIERITSKDNMENIRKLMGFESKNT